MRKPWSWRKSLVILAIAVTAFMALPVAHAQQVFAPGAVVALEGTPHLWIADAQGILHWGGDTRALSGRHINWGARTEVSLERLRALPRGDPWLSAGLLKQGDPIYLVKWETEWPLPRLLHIQSIPDVELFGINGNNYGNFVLDVATWEARYGISVASLQRAALPPAVPSAGTTPTTPSTPTTVAPADIPYQSINGYDGGGGTLNLPQGRVTLQLEFGGWHAGPVTVTYRIDGGAPIHLINNARVGYYGEKDISVPRAASYTFGVTAARDWRIWVGTEPGLPSVPLPLDGCRVTNRWHESRAGVHQARFDCGGVRLDGTSYSAINTSRKHWVVWYRDGRFLGVTSTGSPLRPGDAGVAYQVIRGYNGGVGQLTLPAGRVTITIEYGNWRNAPFTLTVQTPSGEQIRPLDAAMIGYRTSVPIDVAQAGAHRVQVSAERDWRLSVGEKVDENEVPSLLKDVKFLPKDYRIPVNGQRYRQCRNKSGTKWDVSGGVYRADYVCTHNGRDNEGNILQDDEGNEILDDNGNPIATSDTWRGTYYPGLSSANKFWVVWQGKDRLLRVTSHRR